MNSATREQRREDVNQAYELQANAGLKGAAKGTILGTSAAVIAHYSWPTFRRSTLAFKGFLVSICAVSGLIFAAEDALLRHEDQRRAEETAVRRRARIELARQGRIGTETEIAKWKAANGL